LIAILEERFGSAPRQEWEQRLLTEPNLIFTRVQQISDLPTDPAVIANDYLISHDHRHFGPTQTLTHPVLLHGQPASVLRDAPELGEHSGEVLQERLGLSEDELAELSAEGVIG